MCFWLSDFQFLFEYSLANEELVFGLRPVVGLYVELEYLEFDDDEVALFNWELKVGLVFAIVRII